MKITNEQIQIWIEDYLAKGYGEKVKNRKISDILVHKLRKENYTGFAEKASDRWNKKIEENIEELKQIASFDELLNRIEMLRITGIGELSVYDTATCIGNERDVYPQYVYMHAGTVVGAAAIGVKGKKIAKEVFVEKFSAFNVLEPIQIEDFLCIYKSRLQGDVESNISCC